MKLIDNINFLLGDDLKASIHPKARLKIAASCFSIYAYEALKSELSKIESLEFIFTVPAFIPNEVTDKLRKERREFFIPKADLERCQSAGVRSKIRGNPSSYPARHPASRENSWCDKG